MTSQSLDYFIEFIKGLKELSKREKEVLIARLQGKTLKKIGRKHYLTAERIRQIEEQALKKINKTNCQLRLID